MKRLVIIPTILLFCILLTACRDRADQEGPWIGIAPGSDLADVTERTEYYDLVVETEELFDLGLWERNPEEYYSFDIQERGITIYNLLGTQFAEGEPAQLWSEATPSGVNIYLYRTDGSRELLVSRLPDDDDDFADAIYEGYVDQDKNCYLYYINWPEMNGEYTPVSTVMKLLPTGELSYQKSLEAGFKLEDICQTEDGRLYLLLNEYETGKEVLEEFNAETGKVIPESRMEWNSIDAWISSLGTAGVSPARTTLRGIDSVDMAAQKISPLLYFDGTGYSWHIYMRLWDFRVFEDGTMEFLWTDRSGQKCIRERMHMEKVEKTPVVLRGVFEQDSWLSDIVALFNRKSKDYHVVLETCGSGNDAEDFARLTSVQIGAGKGPDILCGSALLSDYISGMLEKGALEVLNPYMEASGIREEDYFPLVFSTWRQGAEIYSVTPRMEVYCEEMDQEVLGSGSPPEIEELANALLAREGSGFYREGLTSGELLHTFLQGSESLWGMVDWGAGDKDSPGSCDFNTPLFAKLLEAAKRYGYEDRRALEQEITHRINLSGFFSFSSPAEQKEEELVSVGTLFDDGCHAVSYPLYTMAVNANSANKEGAWEFIAFLLGDEIQYREEAHLPPVHRQSFDKWLEWELEILTKKDRIKGKEFSPVYYGENSSTEKRNAYKKAIEDARPLPMRTAPILAIIQEEAKDYFNGSKRVEEIIQVINNRVQLYLDERK